jgi:hypothetical protein
MHSEISNTFFPVSIDGLPDLVTSHMEPVAMNFWINWHIALRCDTLVSGNYAWNRCWTACVYSPPHQNTWPTWNVRSSTDNIIKTHVCLASLLGLFWTLDNRPPGPGDTTHTDASIIWSTIAGLGLSTSKQVFFRVWHKQLYFDF